MGEKKAIAKTLSVIAWIIDLHKTELIEMKITPKLNILLTVYKEHWQEMDEFRPDLSFEDLNNIALFLQEQGYEGEIIEYWIQDPFVKIFLPQLHTEN